MKLSILDLSIVPPNGDRHQALMNTIDLAVEADKLGYTRFWVAEHHAAGTGAGRSPEVMIPAIAAQTEKIRVGSGAVLLNHYSPFKVAELFNSMEELYPGRIDMGIGRATTGPVSDYALQRERKEVRRNTDDSADQLVELLHWMRQDFEEDNPFSRIRSHHNGTRPDLWLLGSSPWSAQAAAALGLNYTFAGFINPGAAYPITQSYQKNFKTGSQHPEENKPRLILALNVFAAESEEEAHRLTAPFQLFEQRLRTTGDTQSLLENEENALKILGNNFYTPEPLTDPARLPRVLAGTPDKIASWLEIIGKAYGADEIMIQSVTANQEARMRSHQLLAEACFK